MAFYDLNVVYPPSDKIVSTLDKLGYGTLAVNQIQHGKLVPNTTIKNLVQELCFPNAPNVKLLSRVTLTLEDTSINYQLNNTTKEFDILAVRPTTEKTLQHACTSMDVDIISLDLGARLPYYLKHRTLGSATSRGIYLEICYAASVADSSARRLLLSNASNLVRATRGRGIIVSSEASAALHCRGPYDLINLATFWGLSQDRGKETVSENPRKVVIKAHTRRHIHKGVLKITQQPEVKVYKRPVTEHAGTDEGPMTKKQKQKRKQKQTQTQTQTKMAMDAT